MWFPSPGQPVFPSMPGIPWAFLSSTRFGANSPAIGKAGIGGAMPGRKGSLSTRTVRGHPERVPLL